MRIRSGFFALAAAAVIALVPSSARAQTWTTWTFGSAGLFTGSLFGSTVTYTGGNIGGQLSDGTDVAGTLTYNGGSDFFNPGNPYNQNGMNVPGLGMIQFNGATRLNTITFANAVVNPFIALISVGQSNMPITYAFSDPFIVRSDNNCPTPSYWSCGSYSTVGNSLIGNEFSGTIEFSGTFTSLTFSTDPDEDWHGFTVGAHGAATAVTPEPATMTLVATGLVGMMGVARRRKRSA